MGTLQKKEIEVSHKMKKKEVHDLWKHARSSSSTLKLSQDKCENSNGGQGLRVSKQASAKASPAFGSDQLMKLSSSDSELDQKGPSDNGEDDLRALGASHDNVSIPEPSNPARDSSLELIPLLEDVLSESGNGCGSCKNLEEPYLLESVREQELLLSNLTLNGPISFTNISGKSSLLNLLNYFPQKGSVVCTRKKLLVLDINGILADIVYPPPKGYKADTKIAGRAVFTRPFCSDFLNFCLERFNVAIWSSRSRKIIDRLINYLMGDMKHKLIFCWDLSHCTESNFRTLENKHKALVFKELRKVWERYDPDLPWEKGCFNESNTLLLDDTPYKALLNPPHTAVFPYSYDFKDQADSAIGPKGNIRAYLEELAVADDVQKYIEQHPFGQSAITERSLSWRFYHKVIKGHNAVPARG